MALKACDFLIEVVAQRKGPMMFALLPRVESEYCSHHASLPDLNYSH
jgi:hypothetical protein